MSVGRLVVATLRNETVKGRGNWFDVNYYYLYFYPFFG